MRSKKSREKRMRKRPNKMESVRAIWSGSVSLGVNMFDSKLSNQVRIQKGSCTSTIIDSVIALQTYNFLR